MPSASVAAPRHGAFQSLRFRDYRLMWVGSVLSNTGTWMQNIALNWYVFQLTRSPFWVGVLNFVYFIPMFLSPVGGVLADRFDRRLILLATQTTMMAGAVALGILTETGLGTLPVVLAVTAVVGTAFAADAPARHAFFPSLVPRKAMVNAIALNSAQFSMARVVGPAIAGVMVATVGVVPVFWVNAVSFLAVIGALVLVHARRAADAPKGRPSLWGGIAYLKTNRLVRTMIISIAVMSLFGAPLSALLPVFAHEVFHGGPRAFGILAGSLGIGSVIGSLTLGRAGRVQPRMVGLGLTLAGASLAGLALTGSFVIGVLMVAAFGACYLFTVAATNSQIQTTVDEAVRGRILALFMLAFGGLFPIGSLLAGAIADRIGVATTALAGGMACAAWGLWLLRMRLSVPEAARAAGRPPPDASVVAAGPPPEVG